MSSSTTSNYSTLGNYDAPPNVGDVHEVVHTSLTGGVHTVAVGKPVWGTTGNDVLTHGQRRPGCSGYFNVNAAYGGVQTNCTSSNINN